MNPVLLKYKDDISSIFAIGIDILNGARDLKDISLDLKLLAINGIAQAARIGSNEGQSLITLSGFLSDLPERIAPELNELENHTKKMADEITLCSISVKRFMQYSMALEKILSVMLKKVDSKKLIQEFNLINIQSVKAFPNLDIFSDISGKDKKYIEDICEKNVDIMLHVNHLLIETATYLTKARKRIEGIRRNGFIANYMGSNILIEAAHLETHSGSFNSLVSDIHGIVEKLENKLNNILQKSIDGENILSKLIARGNAR